MRLTLSREQQQILAVLYQPRFRAGLSTPQIGYQLPASRAYADMNVDLTGLRHAGLVRRFRQRATGVRRYRLTDAGLALAATLPERTPRP